MNIKTLVEITNIFDRDEKHAKSIRHFAIDGKKRDSKPNEFFIELVKVANDPSWIDDQELEYFQDIKTYFAKEIGVLLNVSVHYSKPEYLVIRIY